LHYETDDDDSASEDSAVLLFFFSVHREFFLIELTLMVRIFSLAMLVYIVVVDACSGKPGRCLKKMDFIQKKWKRWGQKKQNTPTDHWWLQQDKSRKRGFLSLPNRHMHLTRFPHARTHVKE